MNFLPLNHLFHQSTSAYFGLLLLFCVGFQGCEKGAPVLDENAVITLTASPRTLFNFGDTAVVSVQVFEADGRPVLDGTRIQLTATGGNLVPEVQTVNGLAQAVFTSDASTGTVTVTARSGRLGMDGPVSLDLTVIDRDIAIGEAVLSLNPSNLTRAGGQVEATLVVLGPDGEPLAGKAVIFSSDRGRLNGNGNTFFSDNRGQVKDILVLGSLPEGTNSVQITAVVGSITRTATVSISDNQNPVPAILVSPANPRAGEPVFFNGTTSTDSDGSIGQYDWDFGDGTVTTGASVSHIYDAARQYLTVLRVRDDQGASASVSQLVTIGENQPPSASFVFSPSAARAGEIVSFNASASADSDGQVVAYEWSMGNGARREGRQIEYVYPAAGQFLVTLTVRDDGGSEAQMSQTVTINGNQAPTAEFVFSPSNPRTDTRVAFDASTSSDEDGSLVTYRWNFGDGGPEVTGRQVEHRFTTPGRYQVLLTVIDNEGAFGFTSKEVPVSDNAAPEARFEFVPAAPRVGETVVFDGRASSDSDGQLEDFFWDFGDGGTGFGRVAQHVYLANGDYLVSLRVRDDDGKENFATQRVLVNRGGVPVPVLKIDPETLVPPGGTLLLDGSGTTDVEDSLNNLRFNFTASAPSGVTVTIPGGQGPIRQAEVRGLQLGDRIAITMAVLDAQANEASATGIVQAAEGTANARPIAEFNVDPASLQVPGGTVVLDGSASRDPDGDNGDLRYVYDAQVSGNVSVNLMGNGPIQTAGISGGEVGDTVTFSLLVVDPQGAQDTQFKALRLTAEPSNTAPTASLSTTPSGQITAPPAGQSFIVNLDAGNSTDSEDGRAGLTFNFFATPSRDQIQVAIQASQGAPFAALATVTGALAGDQILFSVEVTDSGGLADQAAVLLVVQP